MSDLASMFEDLDRHTTPKTRDEYVRAPLNYPGGKSRSVKYIIEHLPYRKVYAEPFGGSAAVMLARHPSPLEVYNDRYGGIVAFYRCIRDKKKMEELCDRLDLTIHAREEWMWCKETWDLSDDVERAARWYYMIQYSFGGLCRNFGRSTSFKGVLSGKIRNAIKLFSNLHDRFKNVQVENQDWLQCITDYDSHDTVFYIDPPYIDADSGIYKFKMTHEDHRRLLDVIMSLKGFVAVSGYPNPLYDNQKWSERHEWEAFVSIQSIGGSGNGKEDLKFQEERKSATEVLWIKE
jgi:DNA adenine methylase